MLGHITVPALEESDVPASLSSAVISGLLREELGYRGADFYGFPANARGYRLFFRL